MRFVQSLGLAAVTSVLVACSGGSASDSAPVDEGASALATGAAKPKVFDCKTDTKVDDKVQRIQFSVRNLSDSKKIEILTPDGKEDPDYSPIKVTPTEGRVSALNENLSAATGKSMLRISGDSDGFYLIELALYKNSNYEHGFLRIYGSEDDGPHQYSKVTCSVQ